MILRFRRKLPLQRDGFAICSKLLNHHSNIIFDVGAFDGDTVHLMRKHFPNATYYCFEPSSEAYERLSRIGVKAYPYALSDIDGELEFIKYNNPVTNSIFPIGRDGVAFAQLAESDRIKIKSKTLDAFCKENNVDKIDLLKLDVQGAELKVINGAKWMLTEKRVRVISTELLFVDYYRGQAFHYDIAKALMDHGYIIYDFFNMNYDESTGQLLFADAIFIPRY